ncbi:MAG: HIT domain-containing protein [Alphaproteobacteria bacterium]|nr:HIT domain-containing protein [Rhodospirillaceae bacterium]MDG2481859.1 HIT domain-containing protein [Alphaproteobacteria bacterium]MBT6202151.1 HIT domain-containing protein [Rhodospirillaceae bacterium]MBT6510504.1 HIT domain-containing protein [Rhodospirillaceae bacterium]MBT7611659.1 HIT domain-containing protein [Rhodospirillaceae bacterium]
MSFALDPKLEADTLPAIELELSTMRLMNDARYAWLILVPRQDGLVELTDLAHQDRHRLTDEIDAVSLALSAVVGAYKMNVAALGNAVRQLHVHVIARHEGDPAWPGPVWGVGAAMSYDAKTSAALIKALQQRLTGD